MKQVAVIGLGRFGMSLARTLAEERCQVLAIDCKGDLVSKAQSFTTHAVELDARDADALKSVGILEMDVAVVAIGSDTEASMLATMILKDLGVRQVIAKAVTELHGRFLEKIGADQIISPEIDTGRRLGQRIANPNIVEQMDFGEDNGVFEINIPEQWVGKSIGDLDVRSRYEISILTVKRNPDVGDQGGDAAPEGDLDSVERIISPLATTVLLQGDVLLVLGNKEKIQKLTS